jgi:16S rRNA (uracil1498-N3)-methyltransferase
MLALPAAAARHVQVLRMQPGDSLTLFHGGEVGGEFTATITRMGRNEVLVDVGTHDPVAREATVPVHLAVGMPANERMDWLVEKATELGVASLQPLVTERTVLRLSGERATKKQAHWQAIAIAACEQCGRNQVPTVHAVMGLEPWLRATPSPGQRLILSLQPGTQALPAVLNMPPLAIGGVVFLSGPEGGLSPAEEALALAAGYQPVNLGARTLRAETAALAALVMAASALHLRQDAP